MIEELNKREVEDGVMYNGLVTVAGIQLQYEAQDFHGLKNYNITIPEGGIFQGTLQQAFDVLREHYDF